MEDKKDREYQAACENILKEISDARNIISVETLKLFGTSATVYNQAQQYYRKNPQQSTKLTLIGQECLVRERGIDRPDLTVD